MPEENLHTNRTLLEQVAKGDATAFRQLFDDYRDKVYSFALQFVHNEAMAEEIVQETFIKVWAARNTLQSVEKLDSWLFILTRNLTLNTLKKIARDRKLATELLAQEELTNFTEELLARKEFRQQLQEAVNRLPPQQKLVYTLAHEEGLKREEIAERLQLSPETVKAHLALAMRFLRKYMSNYDSMAGWIILSLFFKNF